MADTKITALAAITTVDPAADVLPIVDVSDTSMAASGTTKKITSNQILGAGGTATLASATITGDLTVDTSTLKVDSANNRVGIGTASPGFTLDVQSAAGTIIRTKGGSGSGQGSAFYITAAGSASTLFAFGDRANIFGGTPDVTASIYTGSGIPLTFDVGASTAMTLNSTGLTIGGSAIGKLTAYSTTNGDVLAAFRCTGTGTQRGLYISADNSTGIVSVDATGAAAGILQFKAGGTNTMQIDTSGNVGVGVTPSAWGIGKVIQIGATSGAFHYGASGQFISGVNAYYDTTWKYASNGFANYYQQSSGIHSWFNAPSGTAGNAITWTQAMTLNAAGSLVLGAAAVATTATDGFLYIPGCAGTPTGTPTAQTGRVPLVVDTTNNKLYFYSGGSWVAAN